MKENFSQNQQNQIPQIYKPFYQRSSRKCQKLAHQPIFERTLRDQPFVYIFLAITFVFIALAIYLIIIQTQTDSDMNDLIILKYKTQIGSCLGICIAITAFYIALLNFSPNKMVYILLFGCGTILSGVSIVFFIQKIYEVAIPTLTILIIYSIVICCLWKKIILGINLLKAGLKFIITNPIIFFLPFIQLILTVGFTVFWVYTLNIQFHRISKKRIQDQQIQVDGTLIGFWFLVWFFFVTFFYYVMVFCISVICSFQFYQIKQKNSIITAYKWLLSSIGSISFISILISIVKICRFFLQSNSSRCLQICRNQNCPCCSKCCFILSCLYCMISCVLGSFQGVLKVLCNSTVIVMAITGQKLSDCARTTMGLICKNIYLLSITKIISNLLVCLGVTFTLGLTMIIAYFWLQQLNVDSQQVQNVLGLIFFSSLLVSAVLLSIISQTTTCAFIFYSLQQNFSELRLSKHFVPKQTVQTFRNTVVPQILQKKIVKKKKGSNKRKQLKQEQINLNKSQKSDQNQIFESIITSN